MNMNGIHRHYDKLTPFERFRLITAAGCRGDEAEQERLKRTGGQVQLVTGDHQPYASAANELAPLILLELLEVAQQYMDLFQDSLDAWDPDDVEAEDEEEDDAKAEAEANGAALAGEDLPPAEKARNLRLAMGYWLKERVRGWKLFCERCLSMEPFDIWKLLPGFDRLERSLRVAEGISFKPEGMQAWMNMVGKRRSPPEPELTAPPPIAEQMAACLETLFRERAAWWGAGGRGPVDMRPASELTEEELDLRIAERERLIAEEARQRAAKNGTGESV
jgi:hypothetical protein